MKEVVQRTYLDILICVIHTNLIVHISMFFLCSNSKAVNLGMVGDGIIEEEDTDSAEQTPVLKMCTSVNNAIYKSKM